VRAQYFEVVEGSERIRELRVFAREVPGVLRRLRFADLQPPAGPDTLRMRIGTIDSDPGRRPMVHVWTRPKAPWFDVAGSLGQIEGGARPKRAIPLTRVN